MLSQVSFYMLNIYGSFSHSSFCTISKFSIIIFEFALEKLHFIKDPEFLNLETFFPFLLNISLL
jgi:hypothetical protein